METLFVVLSLGVQRSYLVPLWMFFTVSMILADFHPDKLPSFLNRCQECQKVYHEFGAKLMEIKVVEINALLNN